MHVLFLFQVSWVVLPRGWGMHPDSSGGRRGKLEGLRHAFCMRGGNPSRIVGAKNAMGGICGCLSLCKRTNVFKNDDE